MKKKLSFLFLFIQALFMALLLNGCENKTKEKVEDHKITFSNKPDSTKENSIQNGISTQLYPNGKKKIEGYYANGKRIGNWMAWYENGNLWSQGKYINGKRNGYSALYYPDGKVRAEGSYKDDKKTGIWSFFDEKGSLQKEIDFDKKTEKEASGEI